MGSGLQFVPKVLLTLLAVLMIGLGCSDRSPVSPSTTELDLELSKAAPVPSDPWALAELEPVTFGSDLDMLSRRALGVDAFGTMHAVYQRGVGLEQVLYYVSKPQGGEWSEPEIIGPAGTYPGAGWLEVREETGEAYVVFHEDQTLKLGIRRAGIWEFHILETPDEYGVGKPAMTIDAAGYAHIAMLINWDTPSGFVMWQIAYGYFDGSSDFHFQVLENSYVPHHGLFAQPDIVARDDGSVAIAYHHGADGQFLIQVEDNDQLGGAVWRAEQVDVRNVIVYPEALEIDREGNLHIAFHTNIELGAEHHVWYAVRYDGRFGKATMVSGDITGARPRMVISSDGEPHLVFPELLGPRTTGRLVHASRYRNRWQQEIIVDNDAVNPSFAMDSQGNGSVLFERQVIQMENHDIKYFGYVAPLQ